MVLLVLSILLLIKRYSTIIMVYNHLDMKDFHPIQSVVKVDGTTFGIGEVLDADY